MTALLLSPAHPVAHAIALEIVRQSKPLFLRLKTCKFFCAQVDILCTHPMFGPDSGKASWQGLNLMFERVRIGGQPERRQRADNFLQVAPFAPYHHADRPLLRCTPRLWKGGNAISLHRR